MPKSIAFLPADASGRSPDFAVGWPAISHPEITFVTSERLFSAVCWSCPASKHSCRRVAEATITIRRRAEASHANLTTPNDQDP